MCRFSRRRPLSTRKRSGVCRPGRSSPPCSTLSPLPGEPPSWRRSTCPPADSRSSSQESYKQTEAASPYQCFHYHKGYMHTPPRLKRSPATVGEDESPSLVPVPISYSLGGRVSTIFCGGRHPDGILGRTVKSRFCLPLLNHSFALHRVTSGGAVAASCRVEGGPTGNDPTESLSPTPHDSPGAANRTGA